MWIQISQEIIQESQNYVRVCDSHLEILYSRGLLCSFTEDRLLSKMPTTVLQHVIKRLKV